MSEIGKRSLKLALSIISRRKHILTLTDDELSLLDLQREQILKDYPCNPGRIEVDIVMEAAEKIVFNLICWAY